MSYNISLNLDLRRKDKNGTYPICLVLYFKQTKHYIPVKVSVAKENWDKDGERILPAAKLDQSTTWYNDRILEKKLEAKKLLLKLDELGELRNFSGSEVKRRIQNKSNRSSFSAYMDDEIATFLKYNKTGNARVYDGCKLFLRKYLPGRKVIFFEDITYAFLKNLENKYIANGNSYNGLATYLRTIRALYNRAIIQWPELKARYPFTEYKIREIKTHKTAISRADMEKLKNHPIKTIHIYWHGRNMFFLSFYCHGMNLSDIAKVKVKDIQNGKLKYQRSKNSKQFPIRLTDQINSILNLYLTDKMGPDDYVFPIINPKKKTIPYSQVQNFGVIINRQLKIWAKELNIDPTLSFNTARHSWATIGRDMGLPIGILSEGLGHNDIQTTQIYLDAFQDDAIDDANNLITQNLAI